MMRAALDADDAGPRDEFVRLAPPVADVDPHGLRKWFTQTKDEIRQLPDLEAPARVTDTRRFSSSEKKKN